MTTQNTSEAYWSKGSIGDRHYVSGQAYPVMDADRHDPPKAITFHADANVVYNSGADGTYWGVMPTEVPEGQPDYFVLPIQEGLSDEARYGNLIQSLETQLGRTGLKVLLY